MALWMACVMLTGTFLAGLCCAIGGRRPVKFAIGLGIAGCAVNLLLAVLGRGPDPAAGAGWGGGPAAALGPEMASGPAVDPLSQAMVLAAILAGLGVLLLAAAICLRLRGPADVPDSGGGGGVEVRG